MSLKKELKTGGFIKKELKKVILLKKSVQKREFTQKSAQERKFTQKSYSKKATQKSNSKSQITQKITQKRTKKGDLKKKNQICITVGPWLIKLYITPPSILTLVSWVPQSRLPFGHSARRLPIVPLALAKPNPAVCSLACRWRL